MQFRLAGRGLVIIMDEKVPEDVPYKTLFDNVVEAIKTAKAEREYAVPLSRLVERSKFAIHREYEDVKVFVKSTSMKKTDGRLDRHKCGACLMVAFMKRLIIENDCAQYEKYREVLAIIAGLTVMATFIKGNSGNYDNARIIAFLDTNNGFILPEPLCDKVDAYEKSWVFELRNAYKIYMSYKDDFFKREGFSVLSLANELFLIESYNRVLAGDHSRGKLKG
jgi:hypothetical protein